jgi:trimeric autotransporter adhesin
MGFRVGGSSDGFDIHNNGAVSLAAILDCAGSCGTAGQVLSSTGTALEWVAGGGGGGGGGSPATPTVAGTVFGSTDTPSVSAVALGYNAGVTMITNGSLPGDYALTAIGYRAAALLPATSGGGTYVGHCSASNFVPAIATGGDNNVFIGREAGQYATEGDIFIGSRAGWCYKGGGGAILIGTSAGCCISNSASLCGIAIGQGAMGRLTTGGRNIAIGSAAMACKDADSFNIAVGECAMCSNCGAQNMIAIGTEAGKSAGGTWATFIGYRAGFLTASSYLRSTAIGYCAESSASNQFTLGNSNITSYRIYGTWTNASDARDKTNVTALPIGLDFINTLNPVKYSWQHREPVEGKDGTQEVGFLAQEFQAAEQAADAADYLHLVEDYDPDHLFINQNRLIPILVKAIQELSAKNDALEDRIAQLEANG